MSDEIKEIGKEKKRWEETTLKSTMEKLPERKKNFMTVSGIPIERLYTPLNTTDKNYKEEIGFPGEYPFTRGVTATMYRGRLWTRRQVVGLGTAKDTNLRHKYVLKHGQTGLSNDFDLPTLIGLDSDDPMAKNEVGRVGVSIDSLKDMEDLFEGIPLDSVSTSFTINHPAPILLAMYVAVAEKQGIPIDRLRGTIQNDPLKEFFAQKTYVFSPRSSIKMVADLFEFCSKHMPLWNPISICGYQTRDSGGTVEQEIAFTVANGIEYVKAGIDAGLEVDRFAPRISFLFYVHNDFFEEIAKFRALRRIWAKILKEKFNARKPESMRLRMHVQTGGGTLTLQQPEVNIIRGTIQALAAVLGGVQSLALSAFDEALSIPSEYAQRMALRTQEVIAFESGVTNTVDPLGGSYYIESLTDRIEERVWKLLDQIDSLGGMLTCVESGYIEKVIAEEAFKTQSAIENKDMIVVGVNEFRMEEEVNRIETFRVNEEAERRQVESLKKLKKERSKEKTAKALENIFKDVKQGKNMMPAIIEAVKSYATEGEIIRELKKCFGEYDQNIVF
ncbi:MAG: methylmalonyl-CoA mutase [Candidatus Aminicenantes bacterium]|nr:methylmalonyl-CoA mutase [Candidatus Aminicenantes bacterium]